MKLREWLFQLIKRFAANKKMGSSWAKSRFNVAMKFFKAFSFLKNEKPIWNRNLYQRPTGEMLGIFLLAMFWVIFGASSVFQFFKTWRFGYIVVCTFSMIVLLGIWIYNFYLPNSFLRYLKTLNAADPNVASGELLKKFRIQPFCYTQAIELLERPLESEDANLLLLKKQERRKWQFLNGFIFILFGMFTVEFWLVVLFLVMGIRYGIDGLIKFFSIFL